MDLLLLCTVTGLVTLAVVVVVFQARQRRLRRTDVVEDKIDLFRISTAVDREELPEGYALGQNYPNPFNPVTTIQYEMKAAGNVKLQVYDVLGRLITTLVDGPMTSGTHQVRFDGANLSSGIYFYRLVTPVGQLTKTMVLMK